MKKAIFISTVVTMMLVSINVKAQDKGKILAGGGLGYATEISTLSVFVKGVYQITDQWEAGLGITYYLPKDQGLFKLTWMGFDLDGHYVFSRKDQMEFYGLAGLHITRVSTPSYNFQGHSIPSSNATSSGLNLGAGGRYQISGNLYGMAEAKYVVADGGFLELGVGILFRF